MDEGVDRNDSEWHTYRHDALRSGCNPGEVPDPTDPANLESPNGRGIMLMRSFVNIRYNESGNQVILEKERTDSDRPLAAPKKHD